MKFKIKNSLDFNFNVHSIGNFFNFLNIIILILKSIENKNIPTLIKYLLT